MAIYCGMAHFFLLGGSETSAETWISVVRHLEAKGHQASALGWADLPWAAGVEAAAAFLERETASLKDVILVGHSASSFVEQMFSCPIDVFEAEWLEKGRRTKEQSPGALQKLYHATFVPAENLERARAYIVCDEDREVRPEWQRWVARQLLGIEPQILQSGHLAHMTQARKLCDMLLQIASSWRGA